MLNDIEDPFDRLERIESILSNQAMVINSVHDYAQEQGRIQLQLIESHNDIAAYCAMLNARIERLEHQLEELQNEKINRRPIR